MKHVYMIAVISCASIITQGSLIGAVASKSVQWGVIRSETTRTLTFPTAGVTSTYSMSFPQAGKLSEVDLQLVNVSQGITGKLDTINMYRRLEGDQFFHQIGTITSTKNAKRLGKQGTVMVTLFPDGTIKMPYLENPNNALWMHLSAPAQIPGSALVAAKPAKLLAAQAAAKATAIAHKEAAQVARATAAQAAAVKAKAQKIAFKTKK